MKTNKAYKYRIYPDEEQKNFINQTIGCARFIYNKMLEDKIKYYKENEKMLINTPAQYNNTEDIPRLCRRRVLSDQTVGVQSPTEREPILRIASAC